LPKSQPSQAKNWAVTSCERRKEKTAPRGEKDGRKNITRPSNGYEGRGGREKKRGGGGEV